jgi:hypothetical protein
MHRALRACAQIRPCTIGLLAVRHFSTARVEVLRRDLTELCDTIDDCREHLYSGDFGDKMQRCTAGYHDAQRAVIALAACRSAAAGKDLVARDDHIPEAGDRLPCGQITPPGVEGWLPDDVRSLWVSADAKWGDLIVDASLM